MLEALTEANVRAQGDPGAELLGTIRAGDLYPVIGRYFRWIQFQYDPAQNGGVGWVFDELVRFVGDETTIPDLTVQALPTVDSAVLDATASMEAITQQPGGILTLTADSRILPAPGLPLPGTLSPESSAELLPVPAVLPTFTYPPDIAAVVPINAISLENPLAATVTPDPRNFAISVSEGVPPIVPILILGGLGLLGLFVTSFRR